MKTIEELDLLDYVAESARLLLNAHPQVVFTSGRRSVQGQAQAMAANIALRRQWIAQTYVQSVERDTLQRWIDDHPSVKDKSQIAAGLAGIMESWTDDQKRRISLHFCGQAFDVQPVPHGDQIKNTIRGLPNLRKFLESEGGLVRWHLEFDKS